MRKPWRCSVGRMRDQTVCCRDSDGNPTGWSDCHGECPREEPVDRGCDDLPKPRRCSVGRMMDQTVCCRDSDGNPFWSSCMGHCFRIESE